MPVSAVLADNEVSKHLKQHTSLFACLVFLCGFAHLWRVCAGAGGTSTSGLCIATCPA